VSPRSTGVDETGRPIVAELGRAETPQETAERKATASAKRRGNQTALNLFIAVLASLAIVAFLVMVVVRPDQGALYEPADYPGSAADAQGVTDVQIIAPALPESWHPNHASLTTGSDGVMVWQAGFTTPEGAYLAIIQGIDANSSWVADQVRDARAGDTVVIDGISWTSYDRRNSSDPGNVAYALVTTTDGSTIVLAGTAEDAEFAFLATAIAKELA
jgi:hypothetical protein